MKDKVSIAKEAGDLEKMKIATAAGDALLRLWKKYSCLSVELFVDTNEFEAENVCTFVYILTTAIGDMERPQDFTFSDPKVFKWGDDVCSKSLGRLVGRHFVDEAISSRDTDKT